MIFLSDREGSIRRCYTDAQIAGAPIHTFAQVRENPALAAHEPYLFATWGVPPLAEADVAAMFPAARAIFYGAGSVQHFARPFLARGIRVFSAWAANAVPVAEFTAAQIILANKGYFQLPRRYASEGWDSAVTYAQGFCGNFDETRVGLLGAGKIGRNVIELLRPYRLRLLVFDPFLSDADAQALGVTRAPLETIFTTCQTISNHLANNAQTQGIISAALLDSMLPNATFINTGRGAQVDEDALIRAMRAAPGRTALLDVTTVERLSPGHPILSEPNILVTPHRAGSTESEIYRMGELMMAAYDDFVHGRPNGCEVTADMLDTMA